MRNQWVTAFTIIFCFMGVNLLALWAVDNITDFFDKYGYFAFGMMVGALDWIVIWQWTNYTTEEV